MPLVVVYVDDRLYKEMCIAVVPKAGVQVSPEELVNHLPGFIQQIE